MSSLVVALVLFSISIFACVVGGDGTHDSDVLYYTQQDSVEHYTNGEPSEIKVYKNVSAKDKPEALDIVDTDELAKNIYSEMDL